MPYNPAIPQANDKLRVSQNDILVNFQGIGTGFAFNHVDLNDANAGKHNLLTMPQQTFPQVVTGSDLLVYNGLDPITTINQLYLKRSTDATDGVPWTAGANAASPVLGWQYLPTGAHMAWGAFSVAGPAGVYTVTVTGPAFLNANSWSVQVTAVTAATRFAAAPTNATQFNITTTDNGPIGYFYFAIGQ